MAKNRRTAFRYADDLDKVITQKCDEAGCTKSELIEGVLRDAFKDELNGKTTTNPAQKPARTDAYDLPNALTGGINRFDRNGKNIFHFKPAEYVNGRQYYRDTMGSNPNTKWYKNGDNWIQVHVV